MTETFVLEIHVETDWRDRSDDARFVAQERLLASLGEKLGDGCTLSFARVADPVDRDGVKI